jgi:zinc/manganese transport system substrate-binding protein
MRDSLRSFLFTLVVALTPALATPSEARLRVVSTTSDLASIVEIVGGDRVQVQSIAKGYQDPHYLEAKPSHMVRLRDADLLVYVGLELEVGWLPLLLTGARNPELLPGAAGHLPVFEGVTLLEVPEGEVSRADGDVHPFGNPHFWLDPRNLLPVARNVERALARLAPEHADEFARRRADFEERLTARISGWEQQLAPYRGHRVVCYHKQWEYLFAWLGVEVAGYIETKAGIPPSPRHVRELQATIERERIGTIVISNFFEPAPAQRIAERTGARVIVLPASVGGESGLDDPFLFFDHLVSSLQAAFEARAE